MLRVLDFSHGKVSESFFTMILCISLEDRQYSQHHFVQPKSGEGGTSLMRPHDPNLVAWSHVSAFPAALPSADPWAVPPPPA